MILGKKQIEEIYRHKTYPGEHNVGMIRNLLETLSAKEAELAEVTRQRDAVMNVCCTNGNGRCWNLGTGERCNVATCPALKPKEVRYADM